VTRGLRGMRTRNISMGTAERDRDLYRENGQSEAAFESLEGHEVGDGTFVIFDTANSERWITSTYFHYPEDVPR